MPLSLQETTCQVKIEMGGLERRWGFLRPWCETLRGSLELSPVKVGGGESCCCLALVASRVNKLSLHRSARDGIVLLSLLAQVDYAGFEYALQFYCDFDVKTQLGEHGFVRSAFLAEKFLLWIAGRSYGLPLMEMIGNLDAPPTPGFPSALERIVESRLRPNLHSEVVVPVALRIFENIYDERNTRDLLTLQATHFHVNIGQTTPGLVCRLSIEIDEVCVEGAYVTETVAHDVEGLLKTAGEWPLGSLQIPLMRRGGSEKELPWIGKLAHQIFCGGGRTPNSFAGVGEVTLGCYGDDAHTLVPRMCTAFAHARAITSLRLRMSVSQTYGTWMWKALAFALFSDYARANSSIKNVSLSHVRVTTEDVEAIAALLPAENPFSCRFDQQTQNVQRQNASARMQSTHKQVTVNEGAVITMRPMSPDESESSVWPTFVLDESIPDSVALGDFNSGSSRISVLLPGYGVCEVAEDEFLTNENHSMEDTKQVRNNVTSLSLEFDGEFASGFPELIALIGASLTRLNLEFRDDAVELVTHFQQFFDIAHVLQSCPKLTELSVLGLPINSDVFLQKIEELNLRISKLRCAFSDGRQIAMVLANKHSRLAKHLKVLKWIHSSGGDDEQSLVDTFAFTDMLPRNSSLQRVHMEVSEELTEFCKLAISEEDGRMLPFPSEPFSLECRQAFLCVFTVSNERAKRQYSQGLAPLSRPDQHILQLIFTFAAERLRRRVEIEGFEST